MERGSTLRWVLLGLAVFLFFTYGKDLIFGGSAQRQPTPIADVEPKERAPEKICTLDGQRFQAELTTRSASLAHFYITDPKYFRNLRPDEMANLPWWRRYFGAPPRSNEPEDLKTNSADKRNPMRTDLRVPTGDEQQVPYDDLDWQLSPESNKDKCVFTYEDDDAKLTKTIATTGKPFELEVTLDVENKAKAPKKHRLTFEETSWKTQEEMKGGLGRQSVELTEMVVKGSKTERETSGDFAPKDFTKKEFTPEHWRRTPGDAQFVAVGSLYFAKIAIPEAQPQPPVGETVADEYWNESRFSDKDKARDPNYGWLYRARLNYGERELKPGEHATYKVLTFNGPKERDLLASLDHGASDVVDLRTFAPIAKALIWYLEFLNTHIGNWGWAICVLTLTVRLLVFPLSISQIKNSAAMRKLKPEMDELNKKYKDDTAQRGLAMQELWRKNGIGNPVLGCLPMLLQIPIWWALWAAIQALVELYHQPFAWFPDLSARDPYFIIPVVLGCSSLLQQRIMPQQGDPSQQKMMMWMMPGIFTVMMLFLPSGLGVYMLTSSVFAIGQQLLVEKYLRGRAAAGPGGPGDIIVRDKRDNKATGEDKKLPSPLGKGKARVGG